MKKGNDLEEIVEKLRESKRIECGEWGTIMLTNYAEIYDLEEGKVIIQVKDVWPMI